MTNKNKKRLKKFGDQVKKLRQQKGLSLRELAARCDLDFQKIGKIEKENINVTLTTLIELAEGLEVPLKELLNIDFDS
jgi:transcriptional regulator with XRE-family HTH domain